VQFFPNLSPSFDVCLRVRGRAPVGPATGERGNAGPVGDVLLLLGREGEVGGVRVGGV
jgi:hypothetical protein